MQYRYRKNAYCTAFIAVHGKCDGFSDLCYKQYFTKSSNECSVLIADRIALELRYVTSIIRVRGAVCLHNELRFIKDVIASHYYY